MTERGEVVDTLCSERFVDRSPAEAVADEARRRGLSVRANGGCIVFLYVKRAASGTVRCATGDPWRRTRQRIALLASAFSNQVWSWDITLAATRPDNAELLLPLRHHGHLQPLRRGRDGAGHGIELDFLTVRTGLSGSASLKHWHPAPIGPDRALGSSNSNDEPMHRSTSR